ncbi:MAG: hypothetical protein AABO41_22025 [Acidobacteriota bacterium]
MSLKVNIKPIAQTLYGFVGAAFLVVGASVLLLGSGFLPDAIKTLITDITQGDRNTIHIVQEFGSLLVFAGLISFWFVRHYERSKFFHWSMTIFWALFALAHWFVAGGPFHASRGAAINTIPFALFLVVGLLRKR